MGLTIIMPERQTDRERGGDGGRRPKRERDAKNDHPPDPKSHLACRPCRVIIIRKSIFIKTSIFLSSAPGTRD